MVARLDEVDKNIRFEIARRFSQKNGYIRYPDKGRIEKEGGQRYKKGQELRFVAESYNELAELRGLLRKAGFRVCNPFDKGRRLIQPVYGRNAVERILEWEKERREQDRD